MPEGIAYQNKDILFKILGQTYKEKSFAAYGINLPPIRELLPTDMPKISANEKLIDNLFYSGPSRRNLILPCRYQMTT